jgi:DNA-binding helix-hairpin-helix protein with protein kinase domain
MEVLFEESTNLTKQKWDVLMRHLAAEPQPSTMIVSRGFSITWQIMHRSYEEGWDRRREKREVRKGGKSTYRKLKG